jgi:hypothetical protein
MLRINRHYGKLDYSHMDGKHAREPEHSHMDTKDGGGGGWLQPYGE